MVMSLQRTDQRPPRAGLKTHKAWSENSRPDHCLSRKKKKTQIEANSQLSLKRGAWLVLKLHGTGLPEMSRSSDAQSGNESGKELEV